MSSDQVFLVFIFTTKNHAMSFTFQQPIRPKKDKKTKKKVRTLLLNSILGNLPYVMLAGSKTSSQIIPNITFHTEKRNYSLANFALEKSVKKDLNSHTLTS